MMVVYCGGTRVVVPPPPPKVKNRSLQSCTGVIYESRMKSLARMFVWWRKLDESIESGVRHCSECQSSQPAPRKAPLHPGVAKQALVEVTVDFAGPFQGHLFLLVVDAHSKWLEAITVTSTASSTAIQCLRALFARFGLPDTLVSDNGTGFTGKRLRIS